MLSRINMTYPWFGVTGESPDFYARLMDMLVGMTVSIAEEDNTEVEDLAVIESYSDTTITVHWLDENGQPNPTSDTLKVSDVRSIFVR